MNKLSLQITAACDNFWSRRRARHLARVKARAAIRAERFVAQMHSEAFRARVLADISHDIGAEVVAEATS